MHLKRERRVDGHKEKHGDGARDLSDSLMFRVPRPLLVAMIFQAELQ